MNTYNKLLLDEIQVIANFLARHIDNANLNDDDSRMSVTRYLEGAIDRLNAATITIKNSSNNDFNKTI